MCQVGDPKSKGAKQPIQEESFQMLDPSGPMCHPCDHKDRKMPHVVAQVLETHQNLGAHPSFTKYKLGDLNNTWLLCLSIS